MPILIISKKYAKIRKFGTKISPPICNLWGKIFYKNFNFYLYTRFHIDTHPISKVLQRLPRYTGLWAGWGLGHMLQSWGRFFLCP